VLIDPQNKTQTGVVFQIYKNVEEGKTPELVMGVDNDGKAFFAGVITATEGGSIGGWYIGQDFIYSEYKNEN
jgi:hypothetical protein